jgi:diaminopimelate epimerase
MTSGEFHKMHGLGNDFVIIDARVSPLAMPPARAKAIADRKTGIGCDQLIVLEPSDHADFKMRIFNADGGEVEACGNATRAVSMLVGGVSQIETLGGTLTGEALTTGAKVTLDQPKFDWDSIPLAYPVDTTALPVAWGGLENPFAVNVGNPHVVFFVEDAGAIDLETLGPMIEHDPLFPERINVNIASVTGSNEIKLRVWERGAGITRACGTGACATAVAGIRKGLVNSPVTISLPGGELEIAWAPGGAIQMTGGATHVFSGTATWDDFG